MAITYDPALKPDELSALKSREEMIVAALAGIQQSGSFRWNVQVNESGARALLFGRAAPGSATLTYYSLPEVLSLSGDAFADDIQFSRRTPYPPPESTPLPRT